MTWTLDEAGTLTISGTGAMTDWVGYSEVPWNSQKSFIETVVIEEGVTSIGNYAFYACAMLTSVTIPDSVTSIGSGAFYQCTSLTSVALGSSVTSIGDCAFSGCSNLRTIIFKGNAPAFEAMEGYDDSTVFFGVTATAYYPADNKTWTEDVMQNYGGTITWVAVEMEEEIPVDTAGSIAVEVIQANGQVSLTIPEANDNYTYLVYASSSSDADFGTWTLLTAGGDGAYVTNASADLTLHVYVQGDANMDGVVSSSDAAAVLKQAAATDDPTGLTAALYDMNGDGVTTADAAAVLKLAAKG